MKKKIVLSTFLLLTGLLIFNIRAENIKPERINPEEIFIKGLMGELNLTYDQNKKAEELFRNNKKEIEEKVKEFDAYRKNMQENIKKIIAECSKHSGSEIDFAEIEPVLDELNKKESELKKNHFKNMITVFNILDSEQRKKLNSIMTRLPNPMFLPPNGQFRGGNFDAPMPGMKDFSSRQFEGNIAE